MERPCVLVVDDEPQVVWVLQFSLQSEGYETYAAHDGLEALEQVRRHHPAYMVLDVMMPRMDGWTTLRRLRRLSDVPVIMLSARDAEADRLRGFELGVDDYVVKPFSLRELAARVRAVLARAARPAEPSARAPLVVGDMEIDFDSSRVNKRDEALSLTPTEYRLLAVLAEDPGRTVGHEELLERVWGPEYRSEVGYVKRYVWYLRQKLEDDPARPRYVQTVRGFGYRLGSG
jgi:two-component system KDP operon response regulator KdpE